MKRLFSLGVATFLALMLACMTVSTAAAQYYPGLTVGVDDGEGAVEGSDYDSVVDGDWGSGLSVSRADDAWSGPAEATNKQSVTITGWPQHYRINQLRIKFQVNVTASKDGSIPLLKYTLSYKDQDGGTWSDSDDLGSHGASYTFDEVLTLRNTSPLESVTLEIEATGRSEGKPGDTVYVTVRTTFNEIHAYDCENAPVGIPNRWSIPRKGDGNVAWLPLLKPWNNWWHEIEVSSTGRILLVLENTELSVPTSVRDKPAKDFDLEVWSADCSQLLAWSKEAVTPGVALGVTPGATISPTAWQGDRVLVDVQAGQSLRTHVFGKTADDYEQDEKDAVLFEAIRIGNINKALAPLGGTQCYRAPAGEPGGTCFYTGSFKNQTTGYDIVDLTFVVTRLSGGNTLVNRDTRNSQNIVKHSESNWILPHATGGIPVLGPGEQHTVTLEVALTTTVGFDLYVDVYGVLFEKGRPVGPASAAANGPESFEGPSFALVTMEGQPVAWLDDAAAPRLFLPAVAK